jgi:hypothetical protein
MDYRKRKIRRRRSFSKSEYKNTDTLLKISQNMNHRKRKTRRKGSFSESEYKNTDIPLEISDEKCELKKKFESGEISKPDHAIRKRRYKNVIYN